MIGRFVRYSWTMPAFFILLTASVSAQQTTPASDIPSMSTTGFPMEALWEYAPEAPEGKLTNTGPYYVSRWGGIVLRGRPEGDRVVTALTILQCGPGKNPAMRVKMLGVPPKNLCASISVVPPGKVKSIDGNDYHLLGQSTGWTVVDFAQQVGGMYFHLLPPANGSEKPSWGSWGITNLGAVFHDEDGKHVFMAPGETVKLTDRVSFEVTPGMEAEQFRLILMGAAMSKWKQ